jgi:hypothetical protein
MANRARGHTRGDRPGDWTDAELKFLAEAPGLGLTMVQVAEQLNRSHGAVKMQAHQHGIRFPRQAWGEIQQVWTPEEDALICELASTTSYGDIARRLGRTRSSVNTRAHILGAKGRTKKQYAQRGAESPRWRGGTVGSEAHYRGDDWPQVSRLVRRRDGRRCQLCGKAGRVVHHKVPWRFTQDNSLDNLVTLCERCHMGRPEHFARTEQEACELSSAAPWGSFGSSPSSEYPGVTWFKAGQKWRAYVYEGGRQVHLGYFAEEADAAAAVRARAA